MEENTLWKNNEIQFMRLLAEMNGAIEFTDEQIEALCASMDLDPPNIGELLERAQTQWDEYLRLTAK